ncbi:hypothetical protein OUZ56_031658 [Daphnia magna]|uniref:Uncharacterized protein n=1 Tax=Daphnia magna TaxID=35525 RepID=A0ABQ9ZUV3_9CRUS|nr:hypothetical protein OUZ56_031658 [Daphnia magna]
MNSMLQEERHWAALNKVNPLGNQGRIQVAVAIKHLKLQKLESLILRITMDEDNRAKGQRARGNAAL